MDRRSFEKAARSARRWGNWIESSFKTMGGMWAKSYRTAVSSGATFRLTGWIQESVGNRNTWDELNLIAQETLRSRKPLPDDLAEWVADVLAGKRPRPMLRRSRHSDSVGKAASASRSRQLDPGGSKYLQNMIIVTAIERLVTKGYRPTTRNSSRGNRCRPEGGSICDAVGVAFAMGAYKTVEALWTEHKRREKDVLQEAREKTG